MQHLALLLLAASLLCCSPAAAQEAAPPTSVPWDGVAQAIESTAPPPATCHARGPLPDPICTTGATNPAVTQDTIHVTICAPGWTATVRPPVAYTNRVKAERMRAYGLAGQDPRAFELDHAVSLELAGNPTAVGNLWPQIYVSPDGWGAHEKDRLENRLKDLTCTGQITLAEAQHAITDDWVSAYEHYVSH